MDLNTASPADDAVLLFSESNTRFLCEIAPDKAAEFESILAGVPCARIGEVVESPRLKIHGIGKAVVLDVSLKDLKEAWQAPLRW